MGQLAVRIICCKAVGQTKHIRERFKDIRDSRSLANRYSGSLGTRGKGAYACQQEAVTISNTKKTAAAYQEKYETTAPRARYHHTAFTATCTTYTWRQAERPFQLQALLHGSGFQAVYSINAVEIDEGKIEAGVVKLVDDQHKTALTLRFTGS